MSEAAVSRPCKAHGTTPACLLRHPYPEAPSSPPPGTYRACEEVGAEALKGVHHQGAAAVLGHPGAGARREGRLGREQRLAGPAAGASGWGLAVESLPAAPSPRTARRPLSAGAASAPCRRRVEQQPQAAGEAAAAGLRPLARGPLRPPAPRARQACLHLLRDLLDRAGHPEGRRGAGAGLKRRRAGHQRAHSGPVAALGPRRLEPPERARGAGTAPGGAAAGGGGRRAGWEEDCRRSCPLASPRLPTGRPVRTPSPAPPPFPTTHLSTGCASANSSISALNADRASASGSMPAIWSISIQVALTASSSRHWVGWGLGWGGG
jgi:hypothetical protein